ncbi:MAG: hypothetical protein EKK53_12525 [Burkholderiales bacterium]|nr:MAG: hypothetical protein EKK53_12525 [Burkholderiales bacterium]
MAVEAQERAVRDKTELQGGRLAVALAGWLAALALAVSAGVALRHDLGSPLPPGTPDGAWVAVTLVSGPVYYGRAVLTSPRQLTLDQVYYVQAEVDGQGVPRGNRLVRRERNDWHAPSRMAIPAERIAMVEPVGAGSRLMQLIQQESSQADAGAASSAAR